jgi:hypothetical protein
MTSQSKETCHNVQQCLASKPLLLQAASLAMIAVAVCSGHANRRHVLRHHHVDIQTFKVGT